MFNRHKVSSLAWAYMIKSRNTRIKMYPRPPPSPSKKKEKLLYLLLQCVCQSSKFFLQQQVLEVALLLNFMDGFDKLAVQLITLALSLADMNKEAQSIQEGPWKNFSLDGGRGRRGSEAEGGGVAGDGGLILPLPIPDWNPPQSLLHGESNLIHIDLLSVSFLLSRNSCLLIQCIIQTVWQMKMGCFTLAKHNHEKNGQTKDVTELLDTTA